MSSPENIVHQDKQIEQIINANHGNAVSALFERYRISGNNRDTFVAALIARLCLLEVQKSSAKGGTWL